MLPQYAARYFLGVNKHFVGVLRGQELLNIEDHHALEERVEEGIVFEVREASV